MARKLDRTWGTTQELTIISNNTNEIKRTIISFRRRDKLKESRK
ncbi:MAG: hypothetical protein ACXAC7_20125 [Candidatus Hodarchaeales archaeon]